MLRLRLFRADDLTSQVESRVLGEGDVRIGRDRKADWSVPDAGRGISREHLTISNRKGLVTLRDTSSNGTFVGEPRQRVEAGRPMPIAPGERVSFGDYVLILEQGETAAGESDTAGVAAPSPFTAPAGIDEPIEANGRRRQPFASEMPADPLAAVQPVSDDADMWERRPAADAGSWDANPSRARVEPGDLIGAERPWRDPPPPPATEAGYGFDAPFERPILERQAVRSDAAAIPSDWLEGKDASPPVEPLPPPAPAEPPPPPPAAAEPAKRRRAAPAAPERQASAEDQSLFDHFCAGAGLSPAAFKADDRARVMEQLGGIYRQSVLGVADLMQDRMSLRNEYRMMRTTVRPDGNNPFKWVPPQRLAVELLRTEESGYTTGERALNDAMRDIKAHMLCMLAGMRAALAETFRALSPDTVEKRLAGRTFMMRGQHDAAAWTEYVELARQLRADTDETVDGAINRAFRQAYEEQLAELTGGRSRA